MSPETQDLETFFQEITEPKPSPRAQDVPLTPGDTAETVDEFFRKLSGLDDLCWSTEDTPNGVVPPPEPLRRNEAKRAVPGIAAIPAIVAAPLRPRATSPGAAAQPRKAGRVRRAFKVAIAGVLFFAVGLGVGWLALSLPRHLAQRAEALAGLGPTLAESSALNAQDSAPGLKPAVATAVETSAADVPAEERAATAAAVGGTSAVAEPQAAPTDPAPAFGATGRGDQTTATPPRGDSETASASGSPGAPRFALQVGACTSFRCVETYRAKLLPHVGAKAIRVLRRKLPQRTQAVQRIRISPLTQKEALALKARLTAADRGFESAYLTAL